MPKMVNFMWYEFYHNENKSLGPDSLGSRDLAKGDYDLEREHCPKSSLSAISYESWNCGVQTMGSLLKASSLVPTPL